MKIVTRDNSLVVLQRDRLLENEVDHEGPKGGPHGPLYTKGTPRLIILIKPALPGSVWLYQAPSDLGQSRTEPLELSVLAVSSVHLPLRAWPRRAQPAFGPGPAGLGPNGSE